MTKPKIGILTLPLNNNYGGIIQLVALYHFLESKGFCPVWIDKKQNYSPIKKLAVQFLKNNPFYGIYDPKNFRKIKLFQKQVEPFLSRYLPCKTQPVTGYNQLQKAAGEFQAVVVGSDQVWRWEYVRDSYLNYFLDFTNLQTKKIAYAVSFGKDYWEGSEESVKKISQLLKDFDLISVREDSAIEVCKKTFGINNAVHVLDPSFLPDITFYEKIIRSIDFNKKTVLFNYVLDPTKQSESLVDQVAKFKQLDVSKIYLNKNSSDSSLIENWLAHFYYADFVITDSFHGMVFSIIFNKQFLVIGNKERGMTRFTSLLKLLDLEHRLIEEDLSLITQQIIENPIDYHFVNKVLTDLRQKSIQLILNTLTE